MEGTPHAFPRGPQSVQTLGIPGGPRVPVGSTAAPADNSPLCGRILSYARASVASQLTGSRRENQRVFRAAERVAKNQTLWLFAPNGFVRENAALFREDVNLMCNGFLVTLKQSNISSKLLFNFSCGKYWQMLPT